MRYRRLKRDETVEVIRRLLKESPELSVMRVCEILECDAMLVRKIKRDVKNNGELPRHDTDGDRE